MGGGAREKKDWETPLAMPKLSPEEALRAFFHYLELSDPTMVKHHLNQSGKSVDAISWSSKDRYMEKQLAGRHQEDDNAQVFHKSRGDRLAAQQEIRKRKAKLAAKREAHKKEGIDPEKLLTSLFIHYNDTKLGPIDQVTKKEEVSAVGFVRMLRDCALMDNKFSFKECGDFFEKVGFELENDDPLNARKDFSGSLKYDHFKILISKLAKAIYPKAPTTDEALRLLIEHKLGPLQKENPKPLPVDQLMNGRCLEMWHEHDDTLKKIFSHYATLEYISADKVSWKGVREQNSTLNMDEYILMMINFEVTNLLSRQKLTEILRVVDSFNDADEAVDEVLYPAYQECLARAALQILEGLPNLLANPLATVTELTAARRFICGLPYFAKNRLELALERRGYSTSNVLKNPKDNAHYEAIADKILERNTAIAKQYEEDYQMYRMAMRQECMKRTAARHGQQEVLLGASGVYDTTIVPIKMRDMTFKESMQSQKTDPSSLNVTFGTMNKYITDRLPSITTPNTDQNMSKEEVNELDAFDAKVSSSNWQQPYDDMKLWGPAAASSTSRTSQPAC
mmetsp:Transcript_22329/g.26866  ORF Transcript_22329/g.26866 Transcript_22329/m.26866 type:complete len:567 (+) Transcript_22329:79-1779(+)|eukprot:CAMPEP_0197844390 /NCGR_PEP_ID=MMETSP1438-20131217/1375_1 /TAXON_ID=1461541 /ORGANISM="Pterosperma sp., Strain CCMP1384" /LENGTH=566 /DNA_ID=CAMNT_0043455151 /DNA_START=76 /DNA_END=1776 /DNA_ORIENTATION=+